MATSDASAHSLGHGQYLFLCKADKRSIEIKPIKLSSAEAGLAKHAYL